MKIRLLLALLSIMVLLACNLATDIFSSSDNIKETPTAVIEASVTETGTAISIQPCLVTPGQPQLDRSTSFLEMPESVLHYLNAGGDPENLVATLDSVNMATPYSPEFVAEDFTGEGNLDLVLLLLDPNPEFMMPSGTLILFQCQLDHYQVAYQSAITEDVSVPIIYSSADLNSDSLSDLLIGHQSCGAHTCFERLEVLSWNGATLENLMGGSSADIPSPTIEVFSEEKEILVTAQGIGSAGAGPFKQFTRRWIWNPETASFLPAPDEFLPSNFRVHLVHDADLAVKGRNYNQALEFYSQVIEDDELQDWADPGSEREILGAYASFRLIHTHLLLADPDSAETAYSRLISNYPPESKGHDFTQMGDAFWNEYQALSDVISACVTAQAFAVSHQETIIDALYFGYANPVYTAEEICPSQN